MVQFAAVPQLHLLDQPAVSGEGKPM